LNGARCFLIDSHCHLDFEAFDLDRQQVIERASAAGVRGILDPAIDLETSQKILELTANYDMVYAALGVHPNSATTWTAGALETLRRMAGQPKVLAIGEIGLDYYRDRAPHELQRTVFESQLALAAELDLPVIIHTRNASPADTRATLDALAILRDWRDGLAATNSPLQERPGVLHSYSGDTQSARQAVELGFYIGITGPVTFRNAPELQKTVAELPIQRLLIETDAPFLTPHPHRGKRNEPAYIGLVADKIAVIHNMEAEAVRQTTASNAERLFNWRANL
jgi:TatD DNase family protein